MTSLANSFDFLKATLTKDPSNLANRDAAVIWHPYTPFKSTTPPLGIVKGEGAYLIDDNGVKYIDAISSWWTNLHGHSHPYIAKKIHEQAQILEHVIFAGCTHEPAVQIAERLLALLPGNFSKVFFSDDGSTAVEVALKMAIQYWKNNEPVPGTRNKILAFRGAYHGDTFGAMSVSERGIFNKQFEEYLFEVIFIEVPTSENISELKSKILNLSAGSGGKSKIAAFIYEPLVQGAGGMKMYDAVNMNILLKIIKEDNIICIADEVMTGFGRTGKLFASGYIEESLDLLQKDECLQNIQYISECHKHFVLGLTASQRHKTINARSLGTILAFEVNSGDNDYLSSIKEKITTLALEQGVLLRPLGNTIYIMPPYCITPIQLEKVYSCINLILDGI